MLLEEEQELKRLEALVADEGDYEEVEEFDEQNEGMYVGEEG